MKNIITASLALILSPVALIAQVTLTVPGGGNVTQCSGHAQYPGRLAFDQGGNGDSSRWLANASAMPNAFVTYSFADCTVINGYKVFGLASSNSGLKRTPKSWSLEGSSDMVDWVLSDHRQDQTDWTSLEARKFETAVTNSFRHWRLTIHENNGAGDYSGLQELEFYGYADYTEPPLVSSLPHEQTGTGTVTLRGSLDAGGKAEAFIAWGDNPDSLVNTNSAGTVSGDFSIPLSGLGVFQTYCYTIFVENDYGIAALPEPLWFTTRGEVFFWGKTGAGPWHWEDPANWLDESGAPAADFPDAPGAAVFATNFVTSATQTIRLSQTVTVGQLHVGRDGQYGAAIFTNATPDAKVIFDNGASPALLAQRNAYTASRFHTDFEVPNGLVVRNESASVPVLFHGGIFGAKPDLTIVKNRFRWAPVADTVFEGRLTTTGTGLFVKDGAHDLTLLGETHDARFGSEYSEGDSGGLHGDGSLTISGGSFANSNNGVNYLFGNRDGTFILTNGARYSPADFTRVGRIDKSSTNAAVVVSGNGTVWDGKKALYLSRSSFTVRDGARAEFAATQMRDGGLIEIFGADPITGAPALLNLNGANLWVAYASPDTPDNRVLVGAGGVLTNGAVLVHGEYAGSTDSFIKVSDGGRVYATLAIGRGGDQAGDAVGNHTIVTGEGSLWAYPSAGTVQIGERGSGKEDRDNFVRVEKGGVFSNAAFNVGYAGIFAANILSFSNRLEITDGGKVFSTLDSAIGANLYTGSGLSRVEGNRALVGGGEGASLWDMGGKNLRVGRSDGNGAHSVGNHLEVRSGGAVANIATLYVGSSDTNADTDNFVRLAGGTIAANALHVTSGNGIEVEVGVGGKITVFGTAAFSSDTFIRPVAAPGVTVGEYEIISAGSINDNGLRLAPDTDSSVWELKITENSVIVSFRKSGTITFAK